MAMLFTLSEATRASSGGKATALGVLLREGLPVPDGFVVPYGTAAGRSLHDAVGRELSRLGDPAVAVRSSAIDEDGTEASAAGQYESVVGVRGAAAVCQAIATCTASARATRVGDYWSRTGIVSPHAAEMAVLVQPVIEADVAGVMFTAQRPGESSRIEASWGLGLAVVGGTVTPDAYEVTVDGTVGTMVGSKHTRVDLDHDRGGVRSSAVAPDQRSERTLDDPTARALAELGDRIAGVFGRPQDVEWAVADGVPWILQSRPITAALPASTPGSSDQEGVFGGVPGAGGVVTAPARIVRGPADFAAVRRGDIVICPFTDPAWTPLFSIAAGVVTETGGALSHAAIVAREYAIPAVLGVVGATTRIADGARVTLDGGAGTVTVLQSDVGSC